MAQVLIRNLPDDVLDSYKVKARLKGTSVEQALRELIVANAPFTADERLALTEEFHASFRATLTPLTKEEIREGLE